MTATHRALDDLDSIRLFVADKAALQGHAFRREHLSTWGINPQVTRTMLTRGRWRRLHHGAYVDAAVLDAAHADDRALHLLMLAATIQGLRMPGYAFGRSAAALHDLPLPDDGFAAIDVIRDVSAETRTLGRPPRRIPVMPRARVRCHELHAGELMEVGGIPVVGRDLAALSAAADCHGDWAVALLDAAAWQRADGPEALARLAADWPSLKGIGTVRSALSLVRSGAQTPLETHSRLRLVRAGLPEPVLQAPIRDHSGLIGYADMLWKGLGVVGEADGSIKYDSRDDLMREKAREDRIRATGLMVVRWTWQEIWSDPEGVAERIRAAGRIAARSA